MTHWLLIALIAILFLVVLLCVKSSMDREEDEVVEERIVRFRTVGDMSCTAAVDSYAATIAEVVGEIRSSTISERGARIDDKRSEAAMEKRKQQGYF